MTARAPETSPAPEAVLLRSLSSAILLDGHGDVELSRETRGAPVEWGGVYGQQVRLTGPWRVGVEVAGGVHNLPGSFVGATVEGELFRSEHRAGPLAVTQRLAALRSPPGAVRSLSIVADGPDPVPVLVTSTFSPFLLPVMVEGIRPVDYRLETGAAALRVRHRGFALSFCSDVLPSRLYVDRASWRGGRRRGNVEEVGSDHELLVEPGRPVEIRFALAGGIERDLDRTLGGATGPLSASPEAVAAATARDDDSWLAGTPEMHLPQAPEIERAYRHARKALRTLYVQSGDEVTGLVAGYPWYASVWCRDLAWMLPAVLWLGDFDWARASIDTVLRFQASADLPLLGGEAGELPMQVSSGPVFLYGTSDTTLLFPPLFTRALGHSGDAALVRRWGPAAERAIAWAARRTDPVTGLVQHGGEVAGLERSAGQIARIRYGIDTPDTTIWDSTDRREEAIDIQVLWAAALRATATLRERVGSADDGGPARLRALADRVDGVVRDRYRWPGERYLYDSFRDGRPVPRLRPNALLAVTAGLFEPAFAQGAVERAAEDDLTTPWGVRTLSRRDEGYSPTAYHDGQVWTIATAWAAEAAWAGGRPDLGVGYLRTIAERFLREGGFANECYRGDLDAPFDSCFLLGLSVGPFLTVLFERLWGLEVDATAPRLRLRPGFPSGWSGASLEGLRIGTGRATLRVDGPLAQVGWEGEQPLTVELRSGTRSVEPGTTETVDVR